MFPSLFLSHGAPTLPLTETPARQFLEKLGRSIGKPRAIIVASAHWETAEPAISAGQTNPTIHDFHGFPRALYELAYPAPGSPQLAERVAALLGNAGLPSLLAPKRGLDHGAWAPLLLMYPDADVPVLQISVQPHLGPAHHLALGRALASLRDEALVIGSGGLTHDLTRFRGQPVDAPAAPDITAFADWFYTTLAERRMADLLDYRAQAPHAVQNHPTEEHLLPFFVALGAGGAAPDVERLHQSSAFGILRMDAYAFH
jgi:4,5-DOPA dioxygenase extradiol